MWPMILIAAGIVMAPVTVYLQHGVINTNVEVWLAYLPCGLLFGGALVLYRRRNYAQVTDAGLRVSNLFSSVLITYEQIKNIRVQPLEKHFEEGRKRMIRQAVKDLKDKPALFLRLRNDDAELAVLRRRLGSQLFAVDTVALPLPDPDGMAWELRSRLPERPSVNLGGRRRPRRGR